MSSVDNTSYDDTPLFDDDTQLFYSIQFWIFLLLDIPSIVVSLVALYYLLLDRHLRQALHNHIIIVLLAINLFYQFTDMTCFIHYFRTFLSFSSPPIFRLIWGYIDWTFYTLQVALYAWVTIERHILIFHDHLVSTRKKRILIHYLPPVIISIYFLLYYAIVFFAAQCENDFVGINYPSFYPCAFENDTLFMFETIVHDMLPTFIAIISSIVLLVRVIWQKYHARRQMNWRQYRKMTIQVLMISSVYLIFPFPYLLITLLHLCGVPSDFGAQFLSRAMFVTYYTLFLFPIVSLGSLPELREQLKKALQLRRQRRAVAPQTLTMARFVDKRVVIQ